MERSFLEAEGLYITEFSNRFFEKELKEEKEIANKVDSLLGKVKGEVKINDKNKWHNILNTVLKELFPQGVDKNIEVSDNYKYASSEYSGLMQILRNFYNEPYFLMMDVAQKIEYNLFRLGKIKKIDLENYNSDDIDFLEAYQSLFKIGRHEYGDDSENTIPTDWAKSYTKNQTAIAKKNKSNEEDRNGKNKVEKRSVRDDLASDMQYLKSKYENRGYLSVVFEDINEEKVVPVEEDNADCNLSCLANEPFLDYLYHIDTTRNFIGVMKDILEELNYVNNKYMYYEWEKLTNYNTIIVVSKFISEYVARITLDKRLTNKEQREFLQQIVLREKNLFLQISSMKNYLTKNILLKQVFAYIEETNYTYIYDLLDCLEENLVLINDQYEHVQTVVYIYAVLIRWKMDEKNDIEVWKKELSEEYPIDSLKRMLLFQNIHKSVCKQKMLMMKQIELTKIDFLKLPFFQDLQKQEFCSFLTAYKIFSIINDSDVWSDDKKIMKIMEENVVITPDIVKDNDFNENTQEYINTPLGRIYTATFGEKNVDGKNTVIEFDKQRNAKLILLSEYPNIMFENIYIDEKYEKVFKLTLKYLLYHFYT